MTDLEKAKRWSDAELPKLVEARGGQIPQHEMLAAYASHSNSELMERVQKLEHALRSEWWSNHGCPDHRYGDDGEMQCHWCGIDFKRTHFATLWRAVGDLRLIAAVTAKAKAPETRNV